jgi:NAD(P)H-hydrate epimerase
MPENFFHLSRDQVRELDRRAIQEFGVPGIVLMENAGRGAAELLLSLNPELDRVLILCGPGNNGGDGFVMARHLENRGVDVDVWVVAPHPQPVTVNGHPQLSPDAFANYRIWFKGGGSMRFIDTAEPKPPAVDWTEQLAAGRGWIVDALFGTGLTRKLSDPYDQIVAGVNGSGRPVLAVDIPTGLDGDTGEPLGPTIRATHTATFVANKKGFANPSAKQWLGEVSVLDIGAPKKLVDEYQHRRP